MQKCLNCGESIPDSAKFCPECGTKVETEDVFSLGDESSDDDISQETMEKIYTLLVANKPSSVSYEDFYKTTVDVFEVVNVLPFKTLTDSDKNQIKNYLDRLPSKAENLWLRTDVSKVNDFKEAIGNLGAFFNYYERKGFDKSLENYTFDKLKLLIDDKAYNSFIDSEKLDRILFAAKKSKLWCDELTERKQIVIQKIEDYCKESNYKIDLTVSSSSSASSSVNIQNSAPQKVKKVEKLGNELVYVEGKGRIKTFFVAKYQVTQKLYESVMGENPSNSEGEFKPVEKVSWYDAVEFCNRLSEKEGKTPCYRIDGKNTHWNKAANGYRLPTEEEWCYVAQGGLEADSFKYSGSDNIDEVCWFNQNSDSDSHEVGLKKPNKLGIFDMSGNICEWCWDAAFGGERYFCGGSWGSPQIECTVTSDNHCSAEDKSRVIGFRLVLSNIE